MSDMAKLLDKREGITLRRFTVDEFHRMDEAGLFDAEPRVELLDGLVVAMPPPGTPHGYFQMQVGSILREKLQGRGLVTGAAGVTLGSHDQPQPDVVVLRRTADLTRNRPADFADVLCVVEISATSLTKDANHKRKLYARYGIIDYLIVDLQNNVVLKFGAPADGDYAPPQTLRAGDSFRLNSLPDVEIHVAPLLALPEA